MIYEIKSLSQLIFNEKDRSYEGKLVTDEQKEIEIFISLQREDVSTQDEIVKEVNNLTDWINTNYSEIIERVVVELIDTYNKNWSDKGTMSKTTFMTFLGLQGISITIGKTSNIYFSCGNLFLGHAIEVRLGNDYSLVQVGLVG